MKKRITQYQLFTVLIVFFAGIFSSAFASTYHVRKDGNDTACNGSANSPATATPNCAFLTVQKGLKIALPGDTVSVHAGDYSSTLLNTIRTGTASARITLYAAKGEIATLGITNILAGHNYITLSGFNFAGFADGTPGSGSSAEVEVGGNYFEYTNNHMQPINPGSYGNALGIRVQGTHITISNSTFEAGTSVNGPSFYSVILLNPGADNAIIDHNIIRNMVDVERVFEVFASNPTYSNNEIYNIKYTDKPWCHPDIWQTWGTETSVSNFLAENNYIHDVQSQIGIVEGEANPHVNGPWVFRNNVFANVMSCMFIGSWQFQWLNNTFFNVASTCPHVIFARGAGTDNFDVRNNIFVGSGDGLYNGWYSFDSGVGDYNFLSQINYTKKPTADFKELHGINGGNPLFVNAQTDCINNACDFHIKAGSVLIGKGTPISTISTDKDGNARIGAWDIGAYAFGSSSALTPPSNLQITP